MIMKSVIELICFLYALPGPAEELAVNTADSLIEAVSNAVTDVTIKVAAEHY